MKDLGGNEFIESLGSWCARNPHLAICMLAAGLAFLIPFLIIFGFGVATIMMTFTGVLVLEGTLLTIVSMIFFACVGGFAIVAPIIGVAAVAAFLGFSHVCGAYNESGYRGFLKKLLNPPPRPVENLTVTFSEEVSSTSADSSL
ncbi:hypothetical protein KR067_001468 [Drosophila pandora]|nr:hypothetical protein KR067_001468 [Drosophila pandora]